MDRSKKWPGDIKEKLGAVFCSDGYEFVDMPLLEMFIENHTAATKDVSKLIGLLSVKDKCSPTINGALGKDLRDAAIHKVYRSVKFC